MQNLEFVLQQMHISLMALTSYEANDIVANSRKNPLEAWRRLQDRRKETKPSAHHHFSWTVLSSGTPSGDRTLGVLRVSLRREDEGQVGRRDQAAWSWDDEIKLAGLESLVPEELEKHLIHNSNRLRTFEDARLEVVTYVEAKFWFENS